MASDSGEDDEGFSESDSDGGFEADMEALRRACMVTGTKFDEFKKDSSDGGAALGGGGATSGPDEDEDDVELVRKIQRRFSSSVEAETSLFMKPLSSLPPCDDEDDFEVLRAIQRRFGQYENDTLKHIQENHLQEPEICATKIPLEEEHSSDLFGDTTNVLERFPDCVDSYNSTQNSKPSNNSVHGIQPSNLIEWHQKDAHSLVTLPPRDSGFPKSAQVFIDAIKKNRSCQKFLRNKMIQIEARIEENKKLRERVKILKDFQVTCRKRTGQALSQKKDARVQLISVPKQRVTSKVHEKKVLAMCYGPDENSHVANYRMALTQYPLSVNRKKWSKEENENLAKGIKQQYQEQLLQKSVELFSGADGLSADSNEFDSILASIRDLDITPENIRLFLPKVNWEQLASMYIAGRSGAECEVRWLNCEDPLINNEPWTRTEDMNLLHTVQQKGIDNWIEIAVSLGTNRTPFQSLARYQRSLNASILKSEWTEAEDNKLRAAVETYGESNWQIVASTLDGRAGTQCSNRWLKSLNPARKRVGKWTSDEDKRLKVAVTLFGPKTWKKIATFVPGRTHVQCRERWVNALDPSLKMDEWTEEEDSKLNAAIDAHGFLWSKIAECVPHRTDNQCLRRWKVLFPDHVRWLQEARKVQKAAFISNFVDRESERSTLKPDDFVSLTAINSDSQHENTNPTGKRKRKSILKTITEEAQTCPVEAPGLTKSNENHNLGADGTNSNKKRSSRRNSKKKKGTDSTNDLSASCPDLTLLAKPCGEDVGAFHEDNASKKKKASSGSRKRKLGCREPGDENTELLMITDGEAVRELGGAGAIESKKASKLRKRKSKSTELQEGLQKVTNFNEAETFGGKENDSFSKKKRRVTKPRAHAKKNNSAGPTENATKKKMDHERSEFTVPSSSQCPSRMECAEQSEETHSNHIASSIEVAKLRPECGGHTEVLDRSQDVSLPPKCSDLDMMCNGNSRTSGPKKSKAGDRTYSDKVLETEDGDDMTVACFLRNELKKRRIKIAKSGSDSLSKEMTGHDRERVESSTQNDQSLTSCNETVKEPVETNLEGTHS